MEGKMSLNNFGIQLANGKTLSRSAQPDADGFNTLIKLGVQKIIKLNTSSQYPLDREVQSFANTQEIPLNSFDPDEESVRNIALIINSKITAGMNVHIHCSHGRDRTGLVIGAWQILYGGFSLDYVMIDRENYGTNWVSDKTADAKIVAMLKKFSQEKGVYDV